MSDEAAKPTSPDVSGLKWVRTFWGLEPRWTLEPDTTAVTDTAKSTLDIQGDCSIEFLAQGAFNKLYVVRHADEEVVARVTLPVDPKWKTLSEVATLQWVREKTTLPVPKVLGYSADRANRIGFEWIIMDKVPGKPYAEVWKEVPFEAKQQLVRRIAKFYSDTFAHQFRGIGNIFPQPAAVQNQKSGTNDDEAPLAPGFTVQRLVSSAFFGEDPHPEVSRGPFASSREWISARLDLTEIQCTKRLHRLRQAAESRDEKSDDGVSSQAAAEEPDAGDANKESADKDEGDTDGDEDEEDDEDDEEDIENALSIIARLRRHLADFFPSGGPEPEPEPSVLFHDDMNSHNVLVDETGNLTAVVDWECVSTLPLCLACEYPPFIQSKPNELEPIKSTYQYDENGEVAVLFWEHLEHWEKTQLRKLFLAEMETLQPDWAATYRSSERQRDFDLAVASCDDSFMMRRIMRWLDDLEASGGEGVRGLQERIDNAEL